MPLITREGKGSKLTIQEMDGNLLYLEQLAETDITITGGTYVSSASTVTFTNNTGGTFSVTGITSGGGGLEGTNYIYVAANGTPTENAAELQAAYDLAKTKASVVSEYKSLGFISPNEVQPGRYGVEITSNPFPFAFFELGESYNVKINGISTTGTVSYYYLGLFLTLDTSNPTLTGLTVTSIEIEQVTINRATVVAAPGYYDFGSTTFVMDTEYVDLVSLDGNRSVIFNSADSNGTISITANNVFVKGVDVETKNFTIANNLNLITIENCKGGDNSFADISTGTFIDCDGGNSSFGGNNLAGGIYINCVGKDNSFGGYYTASGTFKNCVGGTYSFGYTSSGIFTDCEGGYLSFAGYGTASGTYRNCIGQSESFGGGMGMGFATGTFINCEANANSFGGGLLSGKLYYCRLTSGTFQTVSGSGLTRYCIDGNNAANNQG